MGELRVIIPNKLHKALKQEALDKEVTLAKLVLNILQEHSNSVRRARGDTQKAG